MEGIDFCRKTYGIVVEGSLPIHIAYIFLLRSSRMFVFPQDKELALVVLAKCITVVVLVVCRQTITSP